MSSTAKPVDPGLWFVSTPIGNARDITLRALDVLAGANVIAAEDTRNLRKLMDIHGIDLGDRQVLAYHDHNGAKMRPRLLQALADGKSVAYASDAGTPMVADPGFVLARKAIEAGHNVTSAPGVSAVITALTLAGLPTDRFLFAGFLPSPKGARAKTITELADMPASVVFFDSPKRIHVSLDILRQVLGDQRQVAICRELTKKFEEILRGSTLELCEALKNRTLKGEIVLIVDRNRETASEQDMELSLTAALLTMSVKDASAQVAEQLKLPRRQVYQAALKLGQNQ